ncbi:hypothetical protein [Mucilaginibacter sp.]
MKITVKFIAFCLPGVILLNACNKTTVTKTTNSGAYSMALTVNNSSLSFNTCVSAEVSAGSSSQVAILGYNTTNNKMSNNNFEVEIFEDIDSIKVGQVFKASTIFAESHSMQLYYSPDSTNTYITQTGNPIGSVTITEITAAVIKGTFSGGLFDYADIDGNTLLYTATNGSFTAKR